MNSDDKDNNKFKKQLPNESIIIIMSGLVAAGSRSFPRGPFVDKQEKALYQAKRTEWLQSIFGAFVQVCGSGRWSFERITPLSFLIRLADHRYPNDTLGIAILRGSTY